MRVRPSALQTRTAFVVAALLLLTGCTLDSTGKDRCETQADCLDGFVCLDGFCRNADAGLQLDAGYTETNYALELLLPRAVAADAGLTSAHRIFRAYPGLPWEIRAVVTGGAYPYTFSLSGEPAGMTVDRRTGVIRWPDPRAAATPTLTVRDSAGAEQSTTWTIAVTTSGFRFVDAVNGTEGSAGTEQAPWRTLADVHALGGPEEIVYFRAGTYSVEGVPREATGSVWERVVFSNRLRPVIWLAYPGEQPVIDLGAQSGPDAGALIRFMEGYPWLDGFETRNSRVIAVQLESGDYAVLRNLKMRQHEGAADGSGSALVHVTDSTVPRRGLAVQDCEFSDVTHVAALSITDRSALVVEDNRFLGVPSGVSLKRGLLQFSVRNNVFEANTRSAIGGDLAQGSHGEVLFNLVKDSPVALSLNEGRTSGRVNVFRNTLLGRVAIRHVSSTSGPFAINNNVVVNDDRSTNPPHFFLEDVTEPARLSLGLNLLGPTGGGLVDAEGALLPAHAAEVGTHGFQRAPAEFP